MQYKFIHENEIFIIYLHFFTFIIYLFYHLFYHLLFFIFIIYLHFLLPAQRYDNFKLKISKTAVVLIAGVTCHHLGYSVSPALHCTVWCRSTFGPRGQGLSNPTSFLRPALPLAQTTNDNARDEWSVLRPNSATFLRDFTLCMTTNYAIIWKRCLNYITCLY